MNTTVISPADAERILTMYVRDLSTRTASEIREVWSDVGLRAALESVLEQAGRPSVEDTLKDHNPIYYLAEHMQFDKVIDDPDFLYAPLHRDVLCKNVLEYYFAPYGLDATGGQSGSGMLLLLPRDTFKSTFMHCVVPMWILLREKYVNGKDARIALVHQKLLQAKANLVRLKRKFIDHPWVREVWGGEIERHDGTRFSGFCVSEDFGTKEEFSLPNASRDDASEPSVMAAGLGADFTGFHFTAIFFSDLVVEAHMRSKTLREETKSRHSAMIFTVLGGKRFYDGTRYSNADLWGGMERAAFEKRPMYRVIRVKAIGDDDSLAHPFRHSQEKLEALRQEFVSQYGDDTFWYLQMQNEPKISRLIATDPAWLRYCKLADVPEGCWRVVLCDPAWKGTKNSGEGDYAAIETWAFERRGSLVLRYLLEVTHSNEMTSLEGQREIFRHMEKWGTIDVAVEEYGGYTFRGDLENTATSRGLQINLIDLKSKQTSKPERIVTFLRAVQAGQIFITEECKGQEAFLDEYENFPQLDFDDVLDCASYTSDPAIQEQYTPVFNKRARQSWNKRRAIEPQQSRYCGV